MIIKILGVLDILSGFLFWLNGFFNILPDSLMMIIVFYLIIKGLVFVFSKDIASMLDVGSGIVIYLSITFSLPGIIIFLVAFFLLQKGILSLIA